MCYRVYSKTYRGKGSVYELDGSLIDNCFYELKEYEDYMCPGISTNLRGFEGKINIDIPPRKICVLALDDGREINVFRMIVGIANEFVFGDRLVKGEVQ